MATKDYEDLMRSSIFKQGFVRDDLVAYGLIVGGQYNSTPITLTDGKWTANQYDVNGNLMVNVNGATFSATIGNVKLEDGSTTTKATINAANTARTAATTVICVQPVDSLGNIIDATPKTIVGDVKSVTTAGVRVALGTTMAARQIYIKANITNTGNIYVGGVTVTSANGITLAAGDSITLNISDRATVYLDSDVSLEGVGYTLLN